MKMTHSEQSTHKLYAALGSLAGLILLLVWMAGGFGSKTPPGVTQATEPAAVPGPTARVELREIDDVRAWPGTVSARTVAQIAAKVPARIQEMAVKAGDAVTAGQILVRLDERELQAKLNQARASQTAAEAQAGSAGADARRMQNLFEREAATRQMLDSTQAAARSAAARVAEARAAVVAAESVAGEGVLKAPFDGAVIQRLMEPGDMALPGQAILAMQSSQRLRVEAAIPESCAGTLEMGQQLSVRIGEKRHPAAIEEIAPAADVETRTVLVKAALDPQADAQPGTFASLEQACGRHQALLIPASAVIRTGQLESVRLAVDGHIRLRHVRSGKAYAGLVEILSGLREGDVVVTGGTK